jgi:hypothetical protein
MARIVEPPKGKRVTCSECGAVIEYLPEEVERRDGTDISGGPDGWKRVKCPRGAGVISASTCPGYGYIERW